jgi:chaperone BCS1
MKFKIPSFTNLAINKLTESLSAHLAQTIKDIPSNVTRSIKDKFMFTMRMTENNEAYYAFEEWFYQNHEDKFKNVSVFHVPKKDDGTSGKRGVPRPSWSGETGSSFGFNIGYSQNSGSHLIKFEGAYIRVSKDVAAGDKDKGERSVQYYTLSGFNKEKIKKLVEGVYERYNAEHDQIKIFVNNLYGEWNLVKRVIGKSLDNIVINEELHTTLVNDIYEFEKDKPWYDSLNIPYKRGYLLHGPPGNGKTSLSIAIASQNKRNIYCLDVNKLRDDSALRTAFSNLQSNSLLLVEDIDVAFSMGRKMDTKYKPNVTFACLLNCLDGVYYKEGLLTVMTTNHIEMLDSALIRPGRMDLKVFIPNPTKKEVETYLSRFYRKVITLATYTRDIPMAAVQGICITNRQDMALAIEELEKEAPEEDLQYIQQATKLVEPETDADRDEEMDLDDEDDEEGSGSDDENDILTEDDINDLLNDPEA